MGQERTRKERRNCVSVREREKGGRDSLRSFVCECVCNIRKERRKILPLHDQHLHVHTQHKTHGEPQFSLKEQRESFKNTAQRSRDLHQLSGCPERHRTLNIARLYVPESSQVLTIFLALNRRTQFSCCSVCLTTGAQLCKCVTRTYVWCRWRTFCGR